MRTSTPLAFFILLLLICVATLSANSIELFADGEQINFYDYRSNGVMLPQRDDPGEIWIVYDDSLAAQFWETENCWNRVVFTPESEFELWGFSLMVFNNNNDDSPLTAHVYRENQDSGDLEDLLWSGETDELPSEEWIWFELDGGERPTFEEGENFSILFGPAPGGDPFGNGGWSGLGDRPPYTGRSFFVSADEPPADFGDWDELESDLMVRANGEYVGPFTDLAVTALYNHERVEDRRWMVSAGDSVNFYAKIQNLGTDVEAFDVSFVMTNSDGEELFEETVEVDGIQQDDTVYVACPTVWVAEEPYGLHELEVTVLAENDISSDNDSLGLDQIVYGGVDGVRQWLGYTSGDNGGLWNFPDNDDGGWGAMFYHPGGEDPLWLKDIRVIAFPEPNEDLIGEFRIYTYNVAENQTELRWTGDGILLRNLDWMEFNLDEDEYVRIEEGEGVLVSWMQSPGHRLRRALRPPQAAANGYMPAAMWQTEDDGESWERSSDLDCAIQARFDGAHPPMEFGLMSPDDEDTLATDIIEFSWEESVDLNPDDQVSYVVWLSTAEDSVMFETDTTSLEVNLLETDLEFESGSGFGWWVIAVSGVDSLECSNRFSFRYLPSSTSDDDALVPFKFAVTDVHPNPFNSKATIGYELPSTSDVSLAVYDLSGRNVATLVKGRRDAGYHHTVWDATNRSAGVYFVRMEADGVSSVRKLLLVK